MKIATIIAMLTLSLAPAAAFAQGCRDGSKTDVSASSCAEGSVFDAEKGACVPLTSS